MSSAPLTLHVLRESYAICRLAPSAEIPAWASTGSFRCQVRTPEELSIVCAEAAVPAEVEASRGWRALKLDGPFDFSAIGVLLRVAQPLAEERISILPVATYETDYVFVAESGLTRAIEVLRRAGHMVHIPGQRHDP